MEIVRVYDIPSYVKGKDSSEALFFGESDSLEYGINTFTNHQATSIVFDSSIYDSKQILISLEKAKIIVVNSLPFFETFSKELASQKKKGKTIFIWDGVFWDYSPYAESFTAVLTCVTHFVEKYQALDIPAHLLTFSFDSRILEHVGSIPFDQREDKPLFMGTINVGKSAHFKRLKLLYDLRNSIDLKINFGPQKFKKLLYLLLTKPALGLKYAALIQKAKPAVFGRDYFAALGSRKYIINNHLDIGGTAGNIRLFESTGMGALLFTDYLPELENLFDLHKEIAVFKDSGELLDRLEEITCNSENAKRIARLGSEKTLEVHSVENRVHRFMDIIKFYGYAID